MLQRPTRQPRARHTRRTRTRRNELGSPGAVLPFEQADPSSATKAEAVVYNPAYDYVPPELVSLLITNQGAHLPAYIYRLLAEVYHQEDHFLSPSS